MEYTIDNGQLRVTAAAHGAQLQSIYGLEEKREYLWQGDKAYWGDRAPNLFPYIARLTQGIYTFRGKSYGMPIHGIAPYAEFSLRERERDRICFELTSSESTRKQYPFDFRLQIIYSLNEMQLCTKYVVENTGDTEMYFAVGGHPGLNVPPDKTGCFADWRLRFLSPCAPVRMGVTEDVFLNGDDHPFLLNAQHEYNLHHDMFDHDAIVLKESGSGVELYSSQSPCRIRMDYGDFTFLGMWHMPHTDAPYICLEPWSSLFSRKGIVEDLEKQPDLLHLEAGATLSRQWSLSFMNA